MMRRFYSPKENFNENAVTLDADETRHIRDVLRLKIGDEISVFDGEGSEFLCRIDELEKARTIAEIIHPIEPAAPQSPLNLTLASVAIPGDKYDLIVQKAVELGVNTFIPLASVRSEIKLKDLPKKLTRWSRIALDASKQCGRARLMTIEDPRSVTEFLRSANSVAKIFFTERDGIKMPELTYPKDMIAVIGPKGGWDSAEIEFARRNDFAIVTLGGRVLRAETAAIAMVAILQNRFGDIN